MDESDVKMVDRRGATFSWWIALAAAVFVSGAIGPYLLIPDGVATLPPGQRQLGRELVADARRLIDNPIEMLLTRRLALRSFVDQPTSTCPQPPCGQVFAYTWFGIRWARVEVRGPYASAHRFERLGQPEPFGYP